MAITLPWMDRPRQRGQSSCERTLPNASRRHCRGSLDPVDPCAIPANLSSHKSCSNTIPVRAASCSSFVETWGLRLDLEARCALHPPDTTKSLRPGLNQTDRRRTAWCRSYGSVRLQQNFGSRQTIEKRMRLRYVFRPAQGTVSVGETHGNARPVSALARGLALRLWPSRPEVVAAIVRFLS